MIGEICAEIKNYFTYEDDKHIGDWVISDGQISPVVNFPTEYIRIIGSRLNDGVHKVSDLVQNPLHDEEFHGAIWVMSPPADFITLVPVLNHPIYLLANGGIMAKQGRCFQ